MMVRGCRDRQALRSTYPHNVNGRMEFVVPAEIAVNSAREAR